MDYLTRKPITTQDIELAQSRFQQQEASDEQRVLNRQPFYQEPQQLIQDDSASPQVDGIPLYQGVKPGVAIQETMPTYVPPDMAPVTPSAPGVPDPQFRQIELAKGGRVKFNEGSKLTGTDKTLEQNIKEDHKAYNDYRKSIGSPTIPLDNEYIRMWIRSRLNSGGPVKNQAPKVIPMDLESVAFRLFQDNLDNLSYNQKQTVYNYIEDNRNKKADGGRIGYAEGTPMAGLVYVGPWEGPWNGSEFLGGPRKGEYYNAPGSSLTSLNVPRSDLYKTIPTNIPTTTVPSSELNSNLSLKDQYLNRLASLQSSGPQSNVDFKNLLESNLQKKATGGRVKLKDGSEETYNPEIPSFGFSDSIDILEQKMINEKDPTKVDALYYLLENAKKERKAKEMESEEFKKSQKEKGIKYKEDFPSEAAYFAETGKQLLTNPKYFYSKLGKGAIEGTEWLVGQPLKTLFNQEGKNWEFYQPVLGEKLGINKYIEENTPKNPTTGTLLAGDVAEITGSIVDPFLAYGLAKGAIKGAKPKPPISASEETVDPTRRDILKTGAVMGTGALLYPTAKKLDLLKLGTSVKPSVFAEAAKGTTAPSWMDSLITKILAEGTEIKMPKYETEAGYIKKEIQFKNPKTNDTQKATLTIDPINDRISIEYYSPTNVAEQPVLLELKREIKFVDNPDGKSFSTKPDKTKGYRFETTEAGPRVVDWDGNIEFDAEDSYKKIIELKSDISGLKSYATEGKGINKKVAQEKRAATKDVEENPHEYVPENYPDTKYYPND